MSASDQYSVVIVGAGPTGLACGLRLKELGLDDFVILEAEPHVGGLSRSETDERGFVWDVGGHVLFSHYRHFDETLARLGVTFLEHQRVASVRVEGRRVPYPFQNHLRHLGPQEQLECLLGLANRPSQPRRTSFAEWIDDVFGAGIASLFMRPYNEKVWATDLSRMSCEWIAERVAPVSLETALRNVLLGDDAADWGPNSRFRFPRAGGTGAIYRAMAATLGAHLRLSSRVVEIDLRYRSLKTSDGTTISWKRVVSTMPLTELVAASVPVSPRREAAARRLRRNSVISLGIGFDGLELPRGECWYYSPGSETPYYRVTFFSNYSPNNVPTQDCTSVMCEIAFDPAGRHASSSSDKVLEACLAGLIHERVVPRDAGGHVVSAHVCLAPFAYPVPTLGWVRAARFLLSAYRAGGVLSCGRFGAWSYEVGNMDHSFAQGTLAGEVVGHELGHSAWAPPLSDAHWVFAQMAPRGRSA